MKVTSFSQFRRHLASAIDGVNADHEPMMITRGGGKAGAVLMSLEDFAAFEETLHLLKSPHNADRLLEAVMALDGAEGSVRTLIE